MKVAVDGEMVMVEVCVHVPLEFERVTPMVNAPAALGVPCNAPLMLFSNRPEGRAPEVIANNGNGLPLATNVCE